MLMPFRTLIFEVSDIFLFLCVDTNNRKSFFFKRFPDFCYMPKLFVSVETFLSSVFDT